MERPCIIYLFAYVANEHERNCLHPTKSGYEVMAALEAHDARIKDEKKMFNTLIDLLSYEKIIFNGNLYTSLNYAYIILSIRILQNLPLKIKITY